MTSWQRWGVPLAALATSMTWAAAPGLGTTAVGAPRPQVASPPGCYGGEIFDFDDDGRTDVAVGQPDAAVGRSAGAGAVEVRYGCGALPPQHLQLPHPHKNDHFGAAIAQGYYDDGGATHDVLFVGVPYLDVDGHKNAGGVAEFHASTTGLTFVKLWTQATKGVPGKAQAGAHFGAALSLTDVDEEAFALRIGEPGKNVGRATDTGGVVTLRWVEDPDQPAPGNSETTVSHYGVKAQDGDLLGSSFSDSDGTDRVGAPGRRVDGHAGAGAVFEDADPRMIDQDTPGVPGAPETGDHFGAALVNDWIGVPGEALGSVAGAGVVQFWSSDASAQSPTLSQDSPGIPGTVGADHHFGAALAYNDTFAYSGGPEQNYLFVGAPGDQDGVGSVTEVRFAITDVRSGAALLPGADQAGGHFGASVATSGDDRVLVGAPDAGGGRVSTYRLPTDPSGIPVLGASWTRDGASSAGTGYGATLAAQFEGA